LIGDIVEHLRREPEFVAWLGRQSQSQALCAAGIARRWPGAACWALFSGRSTTPVAIVKVAHKGKYARRLRNEYDALRHLAEREEVADSVPRPLALLEFNNRLVSAQTAVGGTQMNVVVSRRWRTTAHGAAQDHQHVLVWLARLHSRATSECKCVDSGGVVEHVDRLLQDTPRRRQMLSHVEALAREWRDAALPLVPGHGDLTPANCFLDRRHLRVIDWEGGLRLRTPLADIVTFLVEYARWLSSWRQRPLARPDALRAAFLTETWLAELTGRTFRDYLQKLGSPPAAAEYLFIATLAELAAGVAPIAHPRRAASYWTELLRVYSRDHEISNLRA
jgi:thiamine kinase-like enzyme